MPLKRPRVPSALIKPLVLALAAAGLQARAEDLVELFNAAHAYDAGYLSARAQADSAVYRARQADHLHLPTVGLTGSALLGRDQFGSSFITVDSNGNPQPTAPNATLAANTTQLGLNGSQPLYNPANGATISQAYKALDMANDDLQNAEQDLIVRVAQAYFDVLAAQDTLGTNRANKAAITEQLASAKRNFEVGTATITDTREAQARFDLATADEIAAENDLRTKRIVLDTLVGRSNVQPNPLATTRLPGLAPADAEDWVSNAEVAHPTIRKAVLNFDVAKLDTVKARAGHLPTVDLVSTFGYTHETGAASGLPGVAKQATIGFQLNVPIFQGGYVQNNISEKLVLEDKAHDDLELARRSVAQSTRTAFFALQSGKARVRALEAAQSSSQLALDATQLGYKVGVRVNVDVLNAQSQLYQTEAQLAKARYDVLVGDLKLRQAAGQLRAEDLLPVNQLLTK